MNLKKRCAQLAVATLAAGSLQAWVPLEVGVWPDGSLPIALEFSSGAPASGYEGSIGAGGAITIWNGFLQRLQLTSLAANGAPSYDNGRNELFFSEQIYGEEFPDGVLAMTVITTEDDRPVEADVVFNRNEIWAIYTGPLKRGSTDFKRVAVHELGHVLSIGHPDEAGQRIPAIMNSIVSDLELPTEDDQAAVHALYDRGAGAPPVILAEPKSGMATQGAAARLTVLAGGRGPLTYSWRRNGVAVPGGTKPELLFAAVGIADAGDYTVVVSNAGGSVTSASVNLSVNYASLSMGQMSVTEGTVTMGGDHTIESGLNYASEPVTYEWKRNGVSIGFTNVAKFTVRDAQFSDAGDYTMTATNIAGSVTSKTFRLSVVPPMPPRFTRDLASVAHPLGSEFWLSPTITGSPPFTYRWQKNGADLPGQNRSSLLFYRLSAEDAGTYTLIVSNSFGQATSDPCLLIPLEAKPVITAQSSAVSEFPGANLTLGVSASGGPYFQWYKDGAPLTDSFPVGEHIFGARSANLSLKAITAADAGIYTAEVTGDGGTATSREIRVIVLSPSKPVIVEHPASHTLMEGGKVSLSVAARRWLANTWQQSTATGYTYQWFKDGQPVAGQTSASFEFTAKAADAGSYVARVTSVGGVTDSDVARVEIVATPPLMTRHPNSTLYDGSDSEYMRLAQIGFTAGLRRRATADGYTGTFVWKSGETVVAPPFDFLFYPGTYTLTLSQNGVTQTSQPFTLGYLPAMVPVLIAHPAGVTADSGAPVSLSVNAIGYTTLNYQWTRNGVAIPGAIERSLTIPSLQAGDAGAYRVTVANAAGATTSEPAVVTLREPAPVTINVHPASITTTTGVTATFSVTAAGGTLRYQWLRDGQPILGATAVDLSVLNVSPGDDGTYAVVVSNGNSAITSQAARLRVLVSTVPPRLTLQPVSRSGKLGGDITLVAAADGEPPPTLYQWSKDDVDLPGATDCKLRLHALRLEDAGRYRVRVTNDAGSTASEYATLTVDPSGRLVNLSSRARVGVGENVLIAGFVVTGTEPRSVLIRGVGAQLRDMGVSRVLRNPVLRVFNAKSQMVATNDNWDAGEDTDLVRRERLKALAAAAAATGAFSLHSGTADAALLTTLAPGSYSAIVSGVADTSGVAMVEIYETGTPDENRLVNLSSRAVVGTEGDILIAGLVLSGKASHRVLIRGVGPGLADMGVSGVLADPTLLVYRGSEIIARNDNWSDTGAGESVRATAAVVGAFALKAGSRDAALVLDLPAGVYTVHVMGAAGGTGVALLEVYEVPQ